MPRLFCPKCSSVKDVIPIEYGLPGDEMMEEGRTGKVRLGGCIIMDDNPEWYCKACRYEWQTDHPEDGRFTCAECGKIEEDCICAPMEELSVDKCPGCNSEKIFKLKWMPYNEQTYRCKKCKLTWDKNTRYCNVCKDVAIYCKCYEDLP